jgi:hypothetical protein
VPQLFVGTGATKWNDPKSYPWTMGWQPSYQIEARIYARYILKNVPDAKIAMLYQNDDSGKDYLTGLRDGLGDKADKLIVATQSYETSDATVDSQILALRASGANVMLTHAIPNLPLRRSAKSTTLIGSPCEIQWKNLRAIWRRDFGRQQLTRWVSQGQFYMYGDGGVDQITAERAQPCKRPLLVGTGELAVSGYVCRKDGCEFPGLRHGCPSLHTPAVITRFL